MHQKYSTVAPRGVVDQNFAPGSQSVTVSARKQVGGETHTAKLPCGGSLTLKGPVKGGY